MNEETITIVIWGILGIVGLLLAVSRLGVGKKLDFKLGLGMSMFGVCLFVLTTTVPQYGVGFSIIGTLILAGTALVAIKQSENQIRGDKCERKLITIITWANDIAKCETAMPLTPISFEELAIVAPKVGKQGVDAILEHRDRIMRINLMMRYQTQDSMRTQIILIAKGLDKQLDSKLEGLAQQTADKLKNHVELGPKFIAKEITDEEYKKHWTPLLEMAKALAEEAETLS